MSTGSGAGPLVPTFHGFVSNSMDGLVLFEACLSGKLHHVPRRPHDRERAQLIKSGSIFIYEENASGIKRWTDGVAWSPSRILGNFLIYRELEKPFPPGEKKRAMKRKRQSLPGEPYPRRESDDNEASEQQITPITPPTPNPSSETKSEIPGTEGQEKDIERSLIGSLVDSYGFRPDGLVKKTMSIAINGISHHMVSYYKVDDVKAGILPRPMSDPRLAGIQVRPELYLKQNFRAPVEETEPYAMDSGMHAHPIMYNMPNGAYNVRPGQYFGPPPPNHQAYPTQQYAVRSPTHYPAYTSSTGQATAQPYRNPGDVSAGQNSQYGQQYQSMYGMPPTTGASPYNTTTSASPYGAVSGTAWPTTQQQNYNHPTYGSQSYAPYKGYSQPVKTEDSTTSQAMPYGQYSSYTPQPKAEEQPYGNQYAPMPRSGSQSTYQT